MASVFTYDPNPPRVTSPWSTPGRATPQPAEIDVNSHIRCQTEVSAKPVNPTYLSETGVAKLEAEPFEGSTEYKLHLLLRPRKAFSSISTSNKASEAPGSQQAEVPPPKGRLRSTMSVPPQSAQPPSIQSRQVRLQQLTTQLLWRLQQSSPFHSCSTASLVLPKLPEATPRLGVPSKPATLLSGLEESQGALYEIGVSDDGSFVGLTEDELDESLVNLKAMAASLGCVVDILRKVIVGRCTWTDAGQTADSGLASVKTDDLWVVEALVRPEMEGVGNSSIAYPEHTAGTTTRALSGPGMAQSVSFATRVEQLRISLTGPTTSGKSSLLGTLTTSTLDTGRGKSRLNLLKHPHEIASGITSSVAQEVIGYREVLSAGEIQRPDPCVTEVINYASENVSSWNDVHASSSRLVFLSDSPGLQRYAKSTIRTLVSWKPHWTILCFAADSRGEEAGFTSNASMQTSSDPKPDLSNLPCSTSHVDPSIMHLELCLKLGLPIIVAVTKMDIATKANLRQILSKLLSALKAAGRRPVLVPTSESHGQTLGEQAVNLQYTSPVDETAAEQVVKMVNASGPSVVPILLTSAVTGQGIGKLHGLLRSLPTSEESVTGIAVQGPSFPASLGNDRPSKIFQIDEIFAMPPSKVYSATENTDADQGTVLCGHVSCGDLSVGDVLALGPFLDSNVTHRLENRSVPHSKSISSPELLDKASSVSGSEPGWNPVVAAQTPDAYHFTEFAAAPSWRNVRVLSIRNLRLPARSLLAGQVGTIGVQPVSDDASRSCDLRHARKGMVLASLEDHQLVAYHSFSASFPSQDFRALKSPPLILGGHATAYINSIKAPVKVISVALEEGVGEMETHDKDNTGAFHLDGDGVNGRGHENISIRFKLLRSVEWMTYDERVLVIPNAVAAGPITGGSTAAAGGLSGFVGRIRGLEQ
jgi:GTPase